MVDGAPPAPTFSGPHRPWFIRLLNGTGGALRALGMRAPRLDFESLLRATGIRGARLDGPGDAAFQDRFRGLLEDAENARLHVVGRIAARRQLTGILRNRILLRRWLEEHPGTLQVPLERPLFVVGQARTGTTLLYNLLARDPASRAPRFWEVARPVPVTESPGGEDDPRLREVERDLRSFLSLTPGLLTAHAIGAREPEECFPLLENSAFSFTFLLYFDIPAYWTRLRSVSARDAQDAYGEYRRQVQILQAGAGGRQWLSKAPSHLFFLGELLEAMPGGRVIMTHREPAESIPSLCSLIAIARSFSSDHGDPRAIGSATLEWYLEAARRSEAARATLPPDRIVDVTYPRLVADPLGTVRSIYDRLGREVTPAFEEGMRSWLASNPQHKHGVHRYSLEQFGLDPEQVRAATADYRRDRLGSPES